MFTRRHFIFLVAVVLIIVTYVAYPLLTSISRPQRAPLDYLDDVPPIPPGKYLFVESWTDIRGSFICAEDIWTEESAYGYSCSGEQCSWEGGRKPGQ